MVVEEILNVPGSNLGERGPQRASEGHTDGGISLGLYPWSYYR